MTNADFNGDGKMDLAAQNAGSNTVSVLLGKGDGTFQPKQDYTVGSGPTSVIDADFNRDGKTDLAVSNYSSDNVSVLLGNGDGTFSSKTDFAAGASPTSVTNSDLNGDGNLDLAVSSFASNRVAVLLGDGNGSFRYTQSFDIFLPCTSNPCLIPPMAAPNQVIAADFNRDTKVDLATANVGRCDPVFGTFNNPGGISVLLGNGDGTFRTPRVYSMGIPVCNGGWTITNVATSISATDVDGDGGVDLAATVEGARVGNAVVSNVTVRKGNGDGTFPTAQTYTVGDRPSAVTNADLDEDAKDDLAVTNFGSDNVSVLFNNDGSFQAAQNFAAGDGPAFVIGADFDADSVADLAVANQNSNNVSVLMNKPPDTTPPPAPVITSPPNNTIDTDGNFTVSGTAEANSTVELFEESTSKGTATADPRGNWSKSLTGVADGPHTYTAKARDTAGNTSAPSNPLTVDVKVPPVVKSVSPADQAQNIALDTNVEAIFSEAMDQASVKNPDTFTLKQGSSAVAATVTYDSTTRKATLDPSSSLASNTTYTATIKSGSSGAKDLAGNALEQDYSWTFTTLPPATIAPDTTITSGPSEIFGSTTASFSFSSNQDDATFECKLDEGPFESCTSPKQYDGLSQGLHTFEVRATTSAGTDDTPASYTWTLDTIPPETTIDSGPSGIIDTDTATFTFSANESNSKFQCTIDQHTWFACTSPRTYTGLSEGTYTFEVQAYDSRHNLDTTPATSTFTVDFSNPPAVIPHVTGTNPNNGDTGVARTIKPKATFDTDLDQTTVNAKNVKLQVYSTQKLKWVTISSTPSYDNRVITVTPTNVLGSQKRYRVVLNTNIKSSTEKNLEQPFKFRFTTK